MPSRLGLDRFQSRELSGVRTQREKRQLDFIVGLAISDLFKDFSFCFGSRLGRPCKGEISICIGCSDLLRTQRLDFMSKSENA